MKVDCHFAWDPYVVPESFKYLYFFFVLYYFDYVIYLTRRAPKVFKLYQLRVQCVDLHAQSDQNAPRRAVVKE